VRRQSVATTALWIETLQELESGVALTLAAALQRLNAAATTIHSGSGRFGGGVDSLELSLSADKAATTECQRKQSADRAGFAATNNANDADTAARPICVPGSCARA